MLGVRAGAMVGECWCLLLGEAWVAEVLMEQSPSELEGWGWGSCNLWCGV